MEKNTGGAAFPTGLIFDDKGVIIGGNNGMTLRDYFAAQAMTGCLPGSMIDPHERAQLAYRMADAMLKARND